MHASATSGKYAKFQTPKPKKIEKKILIHCDSLTKDFKLCEYEQFLKFSGVQHLMNYNGMTQQ